jgi:hypothetical protein
MCALFTLTWGDEMSWICLACDEICYDEVWPWGDATLCNECYLELTDVRLEELAENGYLGEEE